MTQAAAAAAWPAALPKARGSEERKVPAQQLQVPEAPRPVWGEAPRNGASRRPRFEGSLRLVLAAAAARSMAALPRAHRAASGAQADGKSPQLRPEGDCGS